MQDMIATLKTLAARHPVMLFAGGIVLLTLLVKSMPTSSQVGDQRSGEKQADLAPGAASMQATSGSSVDATTRCSTIISMFDGSDKKKVVAIDSYVTGVVRGEDKKHTSNGEPSMIAQLDHKGFVGLKTMALEFCRDKPASTLHDAAADAYDGMRTLQTDFGGHW